MKKFTRLLSATIIAIMTMCLCSFNIFAAGNLQIVIKNTNDSMSIDGNTFSAYKILSATVNADATAYVYSLDDTCVSPSGYDTGYSSVSEISTAVKDESSARTFADYVYKNYIKGKGLTAAAFATAIGETATIDVPTSGYYLVIGEGTDGNGKVITSLAMLGTSSDAKGVEIDLKATVPTIVEKVVREQGDTEWKDITDAEIGETVEFCVHSTVPDLTNYPSYIYKIVDDLSEGLTYKNDSVKVYSDTDCLHEITGLNVSVIQPDNTRFIVFDLSYNFLSLFNSGTLQKDGDIYLKYEATVNDLAKYAKSAAEDDRYNNNKAVVEYSKDLYESGINGNAHATVNSVEKKAYVYTYGVEIDKIQPDGESNFKALPGATFKITKNSASLKFKSGTAVGSIPTYYLSSDVDASETLTGDSDGKFIVYGLDAATTYTLEETAAPAGYAKLDKAIPFQITAGYDYDAIDGNRINTLMVGLEASSVLTANEVSFLDNPLTVKVVNKAAGGQLIGTGGMGTTIFYVCGGIMMAGAVILLFTKIRMGNKD